MVIILTATISQASAAVNNSDLESVGLMLAGYTAPFVGQYNFVHKMKMYVRSGAAATANVLRK